MMKSSITDVYLSPVFVWMQVKPQLSVSIWVSGHRYTVGVVCVLALTGNTCLASL